jgi:hypothetical protein
MRLELLDITEDEAQGLAEIAQLDLAMARTFAAEAQAKASTDPAAATGLARTYHRCTRSYSQTLAIKSRLRRDMALARKHDAAFQDDWGMPDGGLGARNPSTEAFARKVLVRGAVTRVIWNEAEPLEVEHLLEGLEDDLDLSLPHLTLLEEALQDQVERLVGLTRHRLALRRAKAAAAKAAEGLPPKLRAADSS